MTKTEFGPNADPSGTRILHVIGPPQIGGAERRFGRTPPLLKQEGWEASRCRTGRRLVQLPELSGDLEQARTMGAAGRRNKWEQFIPDRSGGEYEALFQFPQTGLAMMVPSRMAHDDPTPGDASRCVGKGHRGEGRHCLDGMPR